MRMRIPFGDWSDDGHGMYEEVFVDAPSMEHLLKAQIKIKSIYGEDFFNHFATSYQDQSVSEKVWLALEETNWIPQDMYRFGDCCDNIDGMDLIDFKKEYYNCIPLEAIESMFIHLLNYYGAEITVSQENNIPQINNWTCRGFKTVGYGCFDL